jgi:hypothetical protein
MLKLSVGMNGIALLVLSVVVGSVVMHAQNQPQAHVANSRSSWNRLEDRALAAKAGDPKSVHDLAHGVFEPFGWANRQEIGGRVEDRIARAELSFRSGEHRPVTEDDVVRAVNGLAVKFGTPEYCKTDPAQVRQLRFELSFGAPHLISSSTSEEGKLISSTMSPAEAAYVTMSMIHQKLFNPKYQATSDEWQGDRQKEHAKQMSDFRSGVQRGRNSRPHLVSSTSSPRTREAYGAISGNAQLMSDGEIQAAPDSVLDDLGVSR